MSLSIAIMGVPERTEQQVRLCDQLVVPATLVLDDQTPRRGIWHTAQRAWERAGTATHHLVLQDDALLCSGFLQALDQLIDAVPDAPLILCGNLAAPMQAAKVRGCPWIKTNIVRHAVAIVLPAPLVTDWLIWCTTHVPASFPHDDVRLEMFLIATGRLAYYPVPSLVRHDSPDRPEFEWWGEADPSALTAVDWSDYDPAPRYITHYIQPAMQGLCGWLSPILALEMTARCRTDSNNMLQLRDQSADI